MVDDFFQGLDLSAETVLEQALVSPEREIEWSERWVKLPLKSEREAPYNSSGKFDIHRQTRSVGKMVIGANLLRNIEELEKAKFKDESLVQALLFLRSIRNLRQQIVAIALREEDDLSEQK